METTNTTSTTNTTNNKKKINIKNIVGKRANRKKSRNTNQPILAGFTKSSIEFDSLVDEIEKKYLDTISKFNTFIHSVNITLNEKTNTKDTIIEQYARLVQYNQEHLNLTDENNKYIQKISDDLISITSKIDEINKIINDKTISDESIEILKPINLSLNTNKGDINDFINEFEELNDKIEEDFTTKFFELKNNIKNALIGFYSKDFNKQISNKKINVNYESIISATRNTDKITILKNIKDKISELNAIYLETVENIKNKMNINEKNNNLINYQKNISIKIDKLNSDLNNKIDNIKTVSLEYITKLKGDVSLLIEQIRKLIEDYTKKHNYSNTKSTMNKLNQLVLENEFSTKGLNNAVNPIIQQLGNIITKVEGQGIEIGTGLNGAETNNTAVSGLDTEKLVNGNIISWSSKKEDSGITYKGKYNISRKETEKNVQGKPRIPVKNVKIFQNDIEKVPTSINGVNKYISNRNRSDIELPKSVSRNAKNLTF
jgi:ElaB/YqjD/DUF883 family membrane-anchored ribosome-binding protein